MEREQPAPTVRVQVRVLNISAGEEVTVMFLENLSGGWEHWYKGHGYPCQGSELCPKGAHSLPKLYWSYAAGLFFNRSVRLWLPTVICASAGLDHQLAGRTLRGEQWVLTRSEAKDGRDTVQGRYLDALPAGDLQAAFDILQVLKRVKGVPHVYLGQPNTTPQKLLLSPSAYPVPSYVAEADEPPTVTPQERKSMAEREREFQRMQKAKEDAAKRQK
jgi:hypothetical protein